MYNKKGFIRKSSLLFLKENNQTITFTVKKSTGSVGFRLVSLVSVLVKPCPCNALQKLIANTSDDHFIYLIIPTKCK